MDSQLLSFVRFLVRFLIDSAMFLIGFSIDSELASDGSPLTLTGLGLDCQLILQSKLHGAHTENAV